MGLGGRDQPFNAGLAVDHDARAEGHGALVCPDQVGRHRAEGFRLKGSPLVQLHVSQAVVLRALRGQFEVMRGTLSLNSDRKEPQSVRAGDSCSKASSFSMVSRVNC